MIGAVAVQLVIPYTKGWTGQDLNVGIIYLVAVTSFTVLAILVGRLGLPQQVLAGRRAARRRPDGRYEVPMILALLVVAHDRRLVEPQRRRRQAAALPLARLLRAVHLLALLRRQHRRAEPRAVRPARGRVRAGGRLRHRVLGHALRHVLPQRVRRPDDHVDGRRHALLRRLGTARSPTLVDVDGVALVPFVWFLIKTYVLVFALGVDPPHDCRACRSTSSWASPGRSSSRWASSTSAS